MILVIVDLSKVIMILPATATRKDTDLRDEIVAMYLGQTSVQNAPERFNVPSQKLRVAMDDLDSINAQRIDANQSPLMETEDHKQVYCWAFKYTKACMPCISMSLASNQRGAYWKSSTASQVRPALITHSSCWDC